MRSRAWVLAAATITAATAGLTNAALAEGVRAVKRLDGYMCMRTVQSDADKEAERRGPPFDRPIWGVAPVFEAPTLGSRQIGLEDTLVIVRAPFNAVDGFVEILRVNGQRGWVEAAKLQPVESGEFAHAGPMVPALLSNGRYHCSSPQSIREASGNRVK